jgi:hypothetical protein
MSHNEKTEKPKVIWIVDGKDWGWDIRARNLIPLLPDYRHKVIHGNQRIMEQIFTDIIAYEPDIIVCNPIVLMPFIPYLERTVFVLTSQRLLNQLEEAYAYQKRSTSAV